ncbi:hypothetical protein [Palaeococcus ferrophilus]|uniref:hypothetical protein n=1 Tax=Palaeococcus ferrophilus TaxID=83868 RepID=UPI00064ECEC1|nr:hypothetical protein [Palaeococcus ferrophilus]
MSEKLEKALFEARPYVEYFDELKDKVYELYLKAPDEEAFLRLLEEEMGNAREPFRTDLRIFIQKFEVLRS